MPQERFCLGLLPTPVHRFAPPGLPVGVEMWIKRDDLTGMQLSGNKVSVELLTWLPLHGDACLTSLRLAAHACPMKACSCPASTRYHAGC